MQLINEDDALGMYIFIQRTPLNAVAALNGSFVKGEKMKMKELVKKLEHKGAEMVNRYEALFIACIEVDDSSGLLEAAEELGEAGKAIIWQRLSNEHQMAARQLLS